MKHHTASSIENIETTKWAEKHFSGAFSTDKRRKQRIISIAAHQAIFPGRSIPQLFTSTYDVKAAYNLFDHPESTPKFIQKGHRELVNMELNQPGTYLLIEDTSELSWSGKDSIPGLGPISDFRSKNQGFSLHSVLAMKWKDPTDLRNGKRPPLSLIGLADQQYTIRQAKPKGCQGNRSHTKKGSDRDRETDLWIDSVERIGAKPVDTNVNWVRVCDRGADLYETLTCSEKSGYDYVIRAAQDRILLDADNQKMGTLFSYAKSLPSTGTYTLDLRGRKGKAGRTALLGVSFGTIKLRSPQRPGYPAGKLPPVACSVVKVKEINPPESTDPIEWVLICSTQVTSFNQAMVCILQYASRWIIE